MRGPFQQDDDELLEGLLAKNPQAFLALVDRHHAGLMRVARTIVRTQASAEEIVQDTWGAFLQALPTFERRSSLKTFLYRILSNLARSRAVKEQRTSAMSELEGDGDETPLADRFGTAGHWLAPPTPWPADSADEILSRKERLQAILEGLAQLPERQRAVVQLRDVEGLSAEEVCELLAVSEVHQRVLLHRGRTKLRAVLALLFAE